MKHAEDVSRASLRPVFWFLALTFIPTYLLETYLISSGTIFDNRDMATLPMLWLLTIMWIPGLAAMATTYIVEGLPFKLLGLRFGPMRPYIVTMIAVPLAFAAMYVLSWKLGLAEPDWGLKALAALSDTDHDPTLKDALWVMLPMSILGGTGVNALFALGEELGWRGFLLPRLIPLGKWKAHLYVGLFWGLWHAPIVAVGFNYPANDPIRGVIMMCLMTTIISIFINEMTLRYRSVLLAAWIHGAINSQGYGIWEWLFPHSDPFLGGANGLTGMAVWAVVAVITLLTFSGTRRQLY